MGGVILFILWTFQKELVPVIGYGLLALLALAFLALINIFSDIGYLIGAILLAFFGWVILVLGVSGGQEILKYVRARISSRMDIKSIRFNKFLDSLANTNITVDLVSWPIKGEGFWGATYKVLILATIGLLSLICILGFWIGVAGILFMSATMLGVLASDLMQGKEITPRLYLVSIASGAILFTAYAVWHKIRKNRPVTIPKRIVESQDRHSFNVIRYFVHQLASDQHDPSCEIFLNTFLFDDYLEKFKKAVDYFANKSKFSNDCIELIMDLQELIIKCEEYITAGKASESNYNEEWFGKTTLVEAIGDITAINDEIMKFQNLLAANE